jgi:hypothetical protein
MRRLSIAVILFFCVLNATMATPHGSEEPNFVGAYNFKREFPSATNISYKVKGQFTEVSFMWNNIRLQAFYNHDGELLATCRPIPESNLPLEAQLSLKKQYSDAIIREVVEYNDPNDGVSYYLTVATPKSAYLLHVSTSGAISVFKKMKN